MIQRQNTRNIIVFLALKQITLMNFCIYTLICITESHLEDKVLDDDIQLDGYYDKPFRKDRNCFGGGVLVYISTTLKVKRRVDLEYDNHEFIWLQLDFSNKSVFICIVYRTQGAINPFWRDFQHSIEQSFNFTQHVVVTGDLNVDLLHKKNMFLKILYSYIT